MSHTTGPWTVTRDEDGEDFELASGPCVLGAVYGSDSYPCADDPAAIDAESTANARLIAAAPDLLEACRLAIRCVESDTVPEAGLYPAFMQIKAAIARATGEAEEGAR